MGHGQLCLWVHDDLSGLRPRCALFSNFLVCEEYGRAKYHLTMGLIIDKPYCVYTMHRFQRIIMVFLLLARIHPEDVDG